MSKDMPWVKMDPGSCEWAEAKLKDETMSADERAYVQRVALKCGLPPPSVEPEPKPRRM